MPKWTKVELQKHIQIHSTVSFPANISLYKTHVQHHQLKLQETTRHSQTADFTPSLRLAGTVYDDNSKRRE